MLQKFIDKLVSKYFNSFFALLENVPDLSLGFRSGKIDIRNTEFRPSFLDAVLFDVPCAIRYGRLGRLQITIPWTSLGTEPIRVEIDDILILLVSAEKKYGAGKTAQEREERENTKEAGQKIRLEVDELVKSHTSQKAAGDPEFLRKIRGDNFLVEFIATAVNNAQVFIRNLHVRFEDAVMCRYGVGVTIETISVVGTNSSYQPAFVKSGLDALSYRLIRLENLAVYLDHGRTYCPLEDKPRNDAYVTMFNMIFRPPNLTSEVLERRFMLMPMTVEVRAEMNAARMFNRACTTSRASSTAMVFAAVHISTVYVDCDADQIEHLVSLSEYMKDHTFYTTVRSHKPSCPPLSNPRAWFQYLGWYGVARARRKLFVWRALLDSLQRDYRFKYCRLRRRYVLLKLLASCGLASACPHARMSVQDAAYLCSLESMLPLQDIIIFRQLVESKLRLEVHALLSNDKPASRNALSTSSKAKSALPPSSGVAGVTLRWKDVVCEMPHVERPRPIAAVIADVRRSFAKNAALLNYAYLVRNQRHAYEDIGALSVHGLEKLQKKLQERAQMDLIKEAQIDEDISDDARGSTARTTFGSASAAPKEQHILVIDATIDTMICNLWRDMPAKLPPPPLPSSVALALLSRRPTNTLTPRTLEQRPTLNIVCSKTALVMDMKMQSMTTLLLDMNLTLDDLVIYNALPTAVDYSASGVSHLPHIVKACHTPVPQSVSCTPLDRSWLNIEESPRVESIRSRATADMAEASPGPSTRESTGFVKRFFKWRKRDRYPVANGSGSAPTTAPATPRHRLMNMKLHLLQEQGAGGDQQMQLHIDVEPMEVVADWICLQQIVEFGMDMQRMIRLFRDVSPELPESLKALLRTIAADPRELEAEASRLGASMQIHIRSKGLHAIVPRCLLGKQHWTGAVVVNMLENIVRLHGDTYGPPCAPQGPLRSSQVPPYTSQRIIVSSMMDVVVLRDLPSPSDWCNMSTTRNVIVGPVPARVDCWQLFSHNGLLCTVRGQVLPVQVSLSDAPFLLLFMTALMPFMENIGRIANGANPRVQEATKPPKFVVRRPDDVDTYQVVFVSMESIEARVEEQGSNSTVARPLLDVHVKKAVVKLVQQGLSSELWLKPTVGIQFFNPRCQSWEPLLEDFAPEVTLSSRVVLDESEAELTGERHLDLISGVILSSPMIRLNINGVMIKTAVSVFLHLMRLLNHLRQLDRSMERGRFKTALTTAGATLADGERLSAQASRPTIFNHTGVALRFDSDPSHVVHNGDRVPLHVSVPSSSRPAAAAATNTWADISMSADGEPLAKVPVHRIGRYMVSIPRAMACLPGATHDFDLLCDVTGDDPARRCIHLRSPVQLLNATNFDLIVEVTDQEGDVQDSVVWKLPRQQSWSVPLQFVNSGRLRLYLPPRAGKPNDKDDRPNDWLEMNELPAYLNSAAQIRHGLTLRRATAYENVHSRRSNYRFSTVSAEPLEYHESVRIEVLRTDFLHLPGKVPARPPCIVRFCAPLVLANHLPVPVFYRIILPKKSYTSASKDDDKDKQQNTESKGVSLADIKLLTKKLKRGTATETHKNDGTMFNEQKYHACQTGMLSVGDEVCFYGDYRLVDHLRLQLAFCNTHEPTSLLSNAILDTQRSNHSLAHVPGCIAEEWWSIVTHMRLVSRLDEAVYLKIPRKRDEARRGSVESEDVIAIGNSVAKTYIMAFLDRPSEHMSASVGSFKATLFTPYEIRNETPYNLTFDILGKNEKLTIERGRAVHLFPRCDKNFHKVIAMTRTYSQAVRITEAGNPQSLWSDMVRLENSIGNSIALPEIPTSLPSAVQATLREGKIKALPSVSLHCMELGLSMQRGTGLRNLTRIVSIMPRWEIFNHTSIDGLVFRQYDIAGADSIPHSAAAPKGDVPGNVVQAAVPLSHSKRLSQLHINLARRYLPLCVHAGKFEYFHWRQLDGEHKVQLCVVEHDEMAYEWSGAFSIETPGVHYVCLTRSKSTADSLQHPATDALEHPLDAPDKCKPTASGVLAALSESTDAPLILRVQIDAVRATKYVFINVESMAPYCIENRLPVPVTFYQRFSRSRRTIEPGHAMPYALDLPYGKRALIIEFHHPDTTTLVQKKIKLEQFGSTTLAEGAIMAPAIHISMPTPSRMDSHTTSRGKRSLMRTQSSWFKTGTASMTNMTTPAQNAGTSAPNSFRMADRERRSVARKGPESMQIRSLLEPVGLQKVLRIGRAYDTNLLPRDERLRITDVMQQQQKRMKHTLVQRIKATTAVMVEGVQVSLINDAPREMLLIYIGGINLALSQSEREEDMDASIQELQIDNMMNPHPGFDVLLGRHQPVQREVAYRKKREKGKKKHDKDVDFDVDVITADIDALQALGTSDPKAVIRPLLSFRYTRHSAVTEIISFKELRFTCEPMELYINEATVFQLLGFAKNLYDSVAADLFDISAVSLAASSAGTFEDDLDREREKQEAHAERRLHQHALQLQAAKRLHFEKLYLGEVTLFLTATSSTASGFRNEFARYNLSNAWIETLVSTTANIHGAPIKIDSLELHDIFEVPFELAQRLKRHFIWQAVFQAARVLGSASILGDPRALFTTVGAGFSQFITKPGAAIVQDFRDVGDSLARGTSVLVTNVLRGGMGFVGRFSSTLARATDIFYEDNRFLSRQRRLQEHGARSTVGGMVLAGHCVALAAVGACVNVYRAPKTGFRKNGVVGGVMGSVRGILGLSVAPARGLLEGYVAIEEGIWYENHIDKRLRLPRCFGPYLNVVPFDKDLANGQAIFERLAASRNWNNANERVLDVICTGFFNYLISTNNYLVFANAEVPKRGWRLELQQMESAEGIEDRIIVRDRRGKRHVPYVVQCASENVHSVLVWLTALANRLIWISFRPSDNVFTLDDTQIEQDTPHS